MREIVLDTETTGLDPRGGHRVVEIGCVELLNKVQTGRTYHAYVNPERDMPAEAFAVHGLSNDFLARHPVFAAVADAFLEFIGTDRLVIHNAEFDMRFLNAELERLGRPGLPADRALDTVRVARQKFPGAQVNLDALCKRFGIDHSNRVKHGALLDAELLAEVYLELEGGRQHGLELAAETAGSTRQGARKGQRHVRPPRPHAPSADELAAHAAFVGRLKEAIWRS